MRYGILAICAAAAQWAAPALADEPRTVPIHMSESGHILADALVDGDGPYTFIVDTAAGSTVVFDDFAAEAGLEDVTGGLPIRVQGASGAVDARLVRVGEMQMGDWTFPLERAVSLPSLSHLDDADGVLGADFLYRQPVGFSLGEGQLDIYDEGDPIEAAELSGAEWFSVPIDGRGAHSRFFWTTVTINGVAIDAVLDTGARRSTINSAGARSLGINPETAVLEEDEPIRGATTHETPAWILPVATVQLGERVWGSRQLTLADLSIFEMMGRADVPTIVFGADFLAEQNFIIDPVSEVLWLQKRRSAALGFLSRPTVEFSAESR